MTEQWHNVYISRHTKSLLSNELQSHSEPNLYMAPDRGDVCSAALSGHRIIRLAVASLYQSGA